MRAAALGLLFACSALFAFSGDVRVAQLPPEARQTLLLIRAGGPFPYARDGVLFGNREGQLPKRSRGYYREYTVKTPGARDRGARRIVVGESGELYYTDDHYRSFRRITDP
ncbi:MAG TPA: ribonuclease [Burkholderiales bacterium]|nr:ribonuclease [Burkholderiales bacterium]